MKLISLNIEGHRHPELQLPFFVAEKPDVLCLQEVYKSDAELMARDLGMTLAFEPMCTREYPDDGDSEHQEWGIAILSHLGVMQTQAHCYMGDNTIKLYVGDTPATKRATMRYVLLVAHIEGTAGEEFFLGTTHFPWTPDGSADEVQRESVENLLRITSTISDLVFCGDFNAPRGGEIFSRMTEMYADNIPAQYVTSIDTTIHRRGFTGELDDKMVDGLFSTPNIHITNVRLHSGVSDHMAIVCHIE